MSKPSHADRDTMVRSVLADRGDDRHTPRRTLFYLHHGKPSDLGKAATHAGTAVHPLVEFDGPVLESMIPVDEESYEAHSQRMADRAEEFDCDCDGRECQQVTN